MISALQEILQRSLERLTATSINYLPPLLAAAVIFSGAFLIASLLRWMLTKVVKAAAVDRFLVQSGLSTMMARSGRVSAGRMLAQAVYWVVLIAGLLTGLSAFNTTFTTRITQASVLLMPKLVTAAAFLLAGIWLARYLGRGMLVWACNEGLPYARYMAAGVRVLVMFVAVVVAADHLNFARTVFLAAFVMVTGGAVLALSIAVGIGLHGALERRFREFAEEGRREEKSLWSHL